MEELEPSSDASNRKWRRTSQIRRLELGMEFEPSSTLQIGNGGIRAKFGHLESEMEEFEHSSTLGIGNGGVRAKFGSLKSGMEEFEQSSDSLNRKWRSSSQVQTLGIGNGGVRAKFGRLESGLEEL